MLELSAFQFMRMAMKTMLALSRQRRLWVCGWIAACTMVASQLGAQSMAPRITSEITNSEPATLRGSLHPMAQARFDAGRLPAATRLNGASIVFSRSAEQEAELQELIAQQQDTASPLYHQWLTPDQFAARFGVAEADLAKVKGWLQQQGFTVDSVARSRNMIRFSGTSSQVEQAFSTEMHSYNMDGERHIAPSSELSLPAALAPIVLAVRNLSDFRAKPMHIARALPDYTSGQTQSVHFAPGDIKVAYNIPSAYTGMGQSIAIMGQSAILPTDIANFQSASGLSLKAPTLVLVPGSGISTRYTGDESESDIDLEWSGGIATGANIIFVYVGSNANTSVFDSMEYAVDQNIAPIISISYGTCETEMTTSDVNTLEAVGAQAVTQGQTVVVSSGDAGSTGCSGFTDLTPAQQKALAVSYPASSAYVTAAGGTEITAANDVAGNPPGYWTAASGGTDVLNSALQWIPEVAWNDDALGRGLSSSGGGASALIGKPSYQSLLTPADGRRDVPDISLYSSPNNPGYLYCSSDSSVGVTLSCSNGFRDGNNTYLTVAGGTSFAAPVFAGMVALINQAKGYTNGQGLINSTLYTLASNSTNYAPGSAFHDVTSGNNNCTAGASLCGSPATGGFAAVAGYDEVTGLGSVNLTSLIGAWTANATPRVGTSTTITATTLAPLVSANDTFTITVVAASGTTTPSGNITLQIDGGGSSSYGTGTTTTVALAATSTAGTARATYTTSFSTAGVHQIVAQYAGNGTFGLSTGVIQVNVAGTSSGAGSFTLGASPSTLIVSQGSSGTETLTVTPAGGYTGTVLLDYTTSNNSALANLCVTAPSVSGGYAAVTVSGTSAVPTTLNFVTNASACAASQNVVSYALHAMNMTTPTERKGPNPAPLGEAFAGLILAGIIGRRSRKFRTMVGLVLLLVATLTISSCGGGTPPPPTTTPPANPAKGTYTITISGHDSVTSTIVGSTSFTLTIN
jgi:subtilase family serine protease